MSNTLAIAHKELKGYFASPIAYIVLGFFALMFGFFFYSLLLFFDRGAVGGQSVNVNEQLIRPVFLNATVIFLFVLPMVTMRTYAEEKRSGTMELLLTAPLTDLQIIIGKFLGAMGLFASMLALSLIHMAVIFWRGNPEPLPVLTTYLGMLLMGGCFVSLGLLISSLTRNQIVAAMATFGIFILLWVIDWMGSLMGPTVRALFEYLSITGHFEDFTRGVLDTKHLVYYASFIIFGLFLTMRSVETERWRG